MSTFQDHVEQYLAKAGSRDMLGLYTAVSNAGMNQARDAWTQPREGKTACYLSAEFLTGRLIYSNLLNLGVLPEFKKLFERHGLDVNMFEGVEDAALGNGGLGRLAACFLDSAATHGLRLDGYGIRYKYGLFRQYFSEGFQREEADDWTRFGDPWSIRREKEKVRVDFKGQSVWAVPYDMPVIGYGGKTVNTLRLWQAEPVGSGFDFGSFNEMDCAGAYAARDAAEAISSVLYPNDDTDEGKRLRLKQQYFFSSASLQSILREYKARHGADFSKFADYYAIQLNDTHPTVAIPELLRLLIERENLTFDEAFGIVVKTFAYTNHTIMAEALEKWDVGLFCSVIPEVYPYIVMLQNKLKQDLHNRSINGADQIPYYLVDEGRIHMARMAVYAGHSVNGVAALHTEILKRDAMREWYAVYPERFSNKTNGITQRRWLGLCNPELAGFISDRIGGGWMTDLTQLKKLEPYAGDSASLEQFMRIKRANKLRLADHIRVCENGLALNTDAIFDVQIKRLHEYKRQLLNALSILDIYFRLKDGELPDFHPMVFLFGAKSAPGYYRAKGIIKFINEIAKLVNSDSDVNGRLQVVFVQNYNVSYAEKLIPAADISEQISTAGTEASGTGNMKLMLNGAVTLGTYDGANVEIVEQAGEENNYIFGARVEDINAARESYNPKAIRHQNPRVKRALDTLVSGIFSDGRTGMFRDLYDSILEGASWHRPDQYFLLLDFDSYVDAKLRANRDYRDSQAFARKCLLNVANSGTFSSDRTIRQYADEIWKL